jgi:hypothetical protein
MMKFLRLYSFVLCLLVLNESWGQSIVEIKLDDCNIPWNKRKAVDIPEVSLTDSILVKEIRKLIEEETAVNDMFKRGLGYIEVFPDYDLKENIVRSYYINVDYTGLKSMEATDPKAYLAYPDYYAFVDGRLIFVKLHMLDGMICTRLKEKTMRKLRKIQNRFLEKPIRAPAYDMNGKKVFTFKHFRIDYFRFHGGKYIYVYSDRPYVVELDPNRPGKK